MQGNVLKVGFSQNKSSLAPPHVCAYFENTLLFGRITIHNTYDLNTTVA
jgi:hypothetical protein